MHSQRFRSFFQKVERHLKENKAQYRGNLGNFTDALEGIGWIREVGQPLSTEESLTRLRAIFGRGFEQANNLLEIRSREPIAHTLSSI